MKTKPFNSMALLSWFLMAVNENQKRRENLGVKTYVILLIINMVLKIITKPHVFIYSEKLLQREGLFC